MSNDILEPALSEALKPGDDPDSYWAAVEQVWKRDPSQVWAAVVPLATSPDERLRTLVPDVLRYLGAEIGKPQPLLEQTVGLLKQMLATESDVLTIGAIADAFNDLRHPAVVEMLLPLTHHELADVRSRAVHGLLQATETVMNRFIELTMDPEPEVRNWTLFALSTLLEARPQHAGALREVFAQRINDPYAEAKAEAVLGLARCLDRRALDPVRTGLKSGFDQYREAAQFLIEKGIGADVLRRALSKIG